MAFERPTLTDLIDRVQNDLVDRLTDGGALLRRSVVAVLARVVAGAAHMLHGHLEYISKQPFATTADEVNLLEIGSMYGIARNPAAFASGAVVVTGTDGLKSTTGLIMTRADGKEYTIDDDVTIASGTGTLTVTAVVAEEDGNCDAGVVLSFQSPLVDVDADATVDVDGLSDGADQEELEAFRLRILDRLRNPPHAGNAADYIAWAKQVPGVTRAWCTRVGTDIFLRFVRDNDSGSIIPSAGEISDVQDYIDSVRPVMADVTVLAPTTTTQNFTITDLTPDTVANREAIEAELADLVRDIEPGGTLVWVQAVDAIRGASVSNFVLTSPAADVPYSAGQMPLLGAVNFA